MHSLNRQNEVENELISEFSRYENVQMLFFPAVKLTAAIFLEQCFNLRPKVLGKKRKTHFGKSSKRSSSAKKTYNSCEKRLTEEKVKMFQSLYLIFRK